MYASRHAPLALATLTALGLSAAFPHAARAQSLTLNSGDSVTVSGAGTVGTIGGQPVANGTTSYTGSQTSGSAAVQTNGTAVFTLAAGGALNGGASNPGLVANGSGAVMITGGAITGTGYGLIAQNSGPVTISGGTISATDPNGGYAIQFTGTGPLMISGGTITATQRGVGLFDAGSGTVTVVGGSFIGGAFPRNGLGANPGATINLFSRGGTPFLIDGAPVNNTSITGYTSGRDTISGTLLNGDPLNATFFSYGTINLNVGTPPAATPEPSACAALALGALSLAGLGLRARRSPRCRE